MSAARPSNLTVDRPAVPAGAMEPSLKLTIHYCEMGNYLRAAHRLLDAVRKEFPSARIESELVPLSGGVFEVHVNDRLIFSKRANNRLPDPVEIFYHVDAIRD